MSDEAFSLWELGSGLPLDGAEAVVTASEFGYNNEYAANACVLTLTFTNDEGEEATQLYSVGKGWEPQDGGSKVGHESGRNMRINSRSIYGMWISAFMATPGALDAAREIGKEPNDASLWLGMRFKLKSHEYEKQGTQPDGKAKTGTTIVPAEYLGIAGAEGKGKSASKSASKPAASKPAASDTDDDDLDPDVRKALVKIAASVEDFDTWLDKALEVEGVSGNKALERKVMSKKADGLYAILTAD